MRNLITYFVKYPFFANIIIAILVIGGGVSIYTMKKSFFPERKGRFITVQVTYPGASPKEMEEGITVRIEESVRGLVGIKEINSTSSENFCQVRIETTGQYDLDETLMEVKNAVDGISSFPSAAERPVIYKQRPITQAAFIGLSGDVDLMTLKNIGNEIEDDFLASGVITQYNMNGWPDLEISVETSEADLLRYGVTFDQIQAAIASNNIDVSGGQIKSEEEEILIRSRERSVDAEKIGEIIIRADASGRLIHIRDVATIKTKFADVTAGLKMNGKQAAWIQVNKLPEQDLDKINKWVRNYVKEFNETHENVQLTIAFDFLDILGERLKLLYTNGMQGLILVILTLGFFLSFRLSFWVAWGIPSAFLAMFMLAASYGITINMISLFGMILVIGILVDDGIVIAENIYTHFRMGKSPRRAAIDGTMEVYPSVVTSVLTTIVAFAPLLILQGAFEFMFEMAFVVIFSLFFSLMEAFFVLPAHLANPHVLRSRSRESVVGKIRYKLEQITDYMRDKMYGTLLKHLVKRRWVTVTFPLALYIITSGLFVGGFIKYTFFPTIPFDSFNINVAFMPGSGEKQTQEYLQRFDSVVWEVDKSLQKRYNQTKPFVTYTFRSAGSAFDGLENGSHAGQVMVFMKDMEDRPISTFIIADSVRKRLGNMPEAMKFTVGGQNRWGAPISISLLGKNLDQLEHAEEFLIAELSKFPELKSITSNNAEGKQEIRMKLKPKAYFLGLNYATLSNQIRQGFYGGQAQRLQSGRDELRIWVRYPKEGRLTIGQLEKTRIKTASGEYPLMELVDFEIERGPVSIKRYNASRESRVDADLVDQYAPVPPILNRVQEKIIPQFEAKYPGIEVVYQGQSKDSAEASSEIMYYFGGAFAIIFLILILHFKSFWQAFIVIMMIPMSWLAAAWGHGIEGIPVSMLSAWGMVALSGVIVNDAVVFLSKYNDLLLEGQTVEQAAYNAGIARFTAIILTTITTAVGLYPIILETSFQAQFLKPMAISLAYGVFIGTGFTLIFFPSIIIVLNRFRVWFRWLWTGVKPTNEEVEPVIEYSKVKVDEFTEE